MPSVAMTLTGRATVSAAWPSYRWNRPLWTSTGVPPSVPATSSPWCPTTVVAGNPAISP